jgi:DNA-binding transcriptional regulator LsrR (DeoR family)
MKFEDYQEKLEQLNKLIHFSNTGTPAVLAQHLNISERTLRRFIERLKAKNNAICFCRRSQSYVIKS